MIGGFPGTDILHDGLDISNAVDNGDFHIQVPNLHRGFLDTPVAPGSGIVNLIQLAVGQQHGNRAQRRLHHAAGGAEDTARAGPLPHKAVEGFDLQVGKVNSLQTHQSGSLPGSQHRIHVPNPQGIFHLRPLHLELFGNAGHDGYMENVFRFHTDFIRQVALDQCAEHLLGRLAGGQMGQLVGVVVLHMLDPTRTAGGQHGQHAAVLQPVNQLRALLHDGNVGREIGIVGIATQSLHGCGNFAGDICSGFQAKLLAEGILDGRSHLPDYGLLRVIQCIHNPLYGALFRQRRHGTDLDALAAVDAGSGGQGHILLGAGITVTGFGIGVHLVNANLLHLVADCDAAAAGNALVHVANHGRAGGIHSSARHISHFRVDLKQMRDLLEPAVTAGLLAGQAVIGMDAENLRQPLPAVSLHCRGVGAHHHAIPCFIPAGAANDGFAVLFQLHGADAAGPGGGQALEIAQGGNLNPGASGSRQNGRASGAGYFFVING